MKGNGKFAVEWIGNGKFSVMPYVRISNCHGVEVFSIFFGVKLHYLMSVKTFEVCTHQQSGLTLVNISNS